MPFNAYQIEQTKGASIEQMGDDNPFDTFNVELHEADIAWGHITTQEGTKLDGFDRYFVCCTTMRREAIRVCLPK